MFLGFKKMLLLGFFIFLGLARSYSQTVPFKTKHTYDLVNDVRIYDLKKSHLTSGVRMTHKVTVSSVWNKDDDQLLKFEIDSFKVYTKPSDSRQDQTYKKTKSNLDTLTQIRFFMHLKDNRIESLYSTETKDTSLLNVQRSVASLFQFDLKNGISTEEDVSGLCSVLYKSKSSSHYEKIKTECSNWALKIHYRTENTLDVALNSFQDSSYKFAQSGELLEVNSKERHSYFLQASPNVGSRLESVIKVSHSGESEEADQLEIENVHDALAAEGYVRVAIEAEVDGGVRIPNESFKKSVRNVKEDMNDENIGKFITSLVFTDLVVAARETKTEELTQVLKARSTQNILSQLIDIYGAAQTVEAHQAVTTVFDFDKEDDFLYLERYVQALTVGTRPKLEIMDDLFEKLNSKIMSNPKLEESTIYALGSMCHNYAQLSSDGYNNKLVKSINEHFIHKFSKCTQAHCKMMYIRGLQNLRNPADIPILVRAAMKEDRATSLAAMKALRSYDIKHFSAENKKIFEKIFYQLSKKFDSSVRTLALDMLLDMKPDSVDLKNLLNYLKSNDKEYELKTYLLQRLRMIADDCFFFREQFRKTLHENKEINNYHVMAPKGITTALRRRFSSAPSFNASLLSFQEIKTGVLKRGVVDLVLESGKNSFNVFKLELLASGLDSFMGDSEDTEDEGEESTATAGMEVSVQENLLRPLEFFNGKSELMGHVWSGTASEPTPAYQATTLLHDHEEYIILQTGGTVYLRILSASSIDLNGQVQISIWNRNAHCQVDKNTGLAVVGMMSYGSSYAYLQNKFIITQEPKISVVADLDFYNDVLLCMRLEVPESTLWHNTVKMQSVKGTNRITQNSMNVTYEIPGRTLALNKKNNEMCSIIARTE